MAIETSAAGPPAQIDVLRKIRIESDGTVGGTKVFDEHGRMIGNIKAIRFEADADGGTVGATITLIVRDFSVDLPKLSATFNVEGDA